VGSNRFRLTCCPRPELRDSACLVIRKRAVGPPSLARQLRPVLLPDRSAVSSRTGACDALNPIRPTGMTGPQVRVLTSVCARPRSTPLPQQGAVRCGSCGRCCGLASAPQSPPPRPARAIKLLRVRHTESASPLICSRIFTPAHARFHAVRVGAATPATGNARRARLTSIRIARGPRPALLDRDSPQAQNPVPQWAPSAYCSTRSVRSTPPLHPVSLRSSVRCVQHGPAAPSIPHLNHHMPVTPSTNNGAAYFIPLCHPHTHHHPLATPSPLATAVSTAPPR
jgi:hypothetical protein